MTTAGVPTLDLRDFETDKAGFTAALGQAYERFGFCAIANHGIPDDVIDEAYEVLHAFFALPEEVKARYAVADGGGARGYTGFGIETAKDSQHPDLKEFWQVGREIPRDHPFAERMPPNLWPTEIQGFKERTWRLYEALDGLGRRILRAMALHLGLEENWFDSRVDLGNSILRPIHYPPIAQSDTPSVRSGRHEDINLITLLIGAEGPGLEILTREGDWLPLTAVPGAIVCNIGDMMQRLTNHVFPSTTHRVVNPPGELATKPRYSIPFFLHPNPDFVIDTLPSCISDENPNRYPEPLESHEYLMQRLREIGLLPGVRD